MALNRDYVWLLVWMLVVVGLLAGCSDEPTLNSDAQREVDLGWQAYEANDYAQALLSFERAVAQAPGLADAQNGLGWSRLGQSQELATNPHLVEQAIDAFREALRQDAGHGDAWVGLASTLFLRRQSPKDFAQSIDAIDTALGLSDTVWLYRHDYSGAGDLMALKAICHYYLGDAESALGEAQNALQVEPEQPAAVALMRILSSGT